MLPPLVIDLKQPARAEHGWEPDQRPREFELDLDVEADRLKSRSLHQIALLGIAGFTRLGGTDFARRDDLVRCWERWRIAWSPDLDASAHRGGAVRLDARRGGRGAAARGRRRIERDARAAALLLLDAVLAGLDSIAGELHDRLAELIRQDGDFLAVTGALGHLLYLYRHDATLGSRGRGGLGSLLVEAFGAGSGCSRAWARSPATTPSWSRASGPCSRPSSSAPRDTGLDRDRVPRRARPGRGRREPDRRSSGARPTGPCGRWARPTPIGCGRSSSSSPIRAGWATSSPDCSAWHARPRSGRST